MTNGLDPDKDQQNVSPDLGPNCLHLGIMRKEARKDFYSTTVVPTKSDSDIILCLQLLRNTNVYTSLELTQIGRSLEY